MAGFLLFYPAMRGFPRNIAILLALCTLAVTGVASTAVAGRGGATPSAAMRLSKGAQVRYNRMKQKLSLRPRGALQQKTRRMLRLGKRKMMRAMSRRERVSPTRTELMRASSRREVGLGGREAERTRARFARDIDDPADHGPRPKVASGGNTRRDQEELEAASLVQRRKMRDRAERRATKAFKKLRRRGD